MQIEKLGNTTILIADEGKCFKGEFIVDIVSTINLGKFDSKENYTEVDIDEYKNELAMKKHADKNLTEYEIEANVIAESLEEDIKLNEEGAI